MWTRRQAGVTLVELIIAIVILGVAVGGMVAAFKTTSVNSADPVVLKQMAAIAEGMMEEITLKPFDVAPNVTGSGRDAFTDVRDFDGYGLDAGGNLIAGIVDVSGNAVPGLSTYSVRVTVTTVTLPSVAANEALMIKVEVTNSNTTTGAKANLTSYVLYGWRTRYA
jgi:MSHA pilin protein MshD